MILRYKIVKLSFLIVLFSSLYGAPTKDADLEKNFHKKMNDEFVENFLDNAYDVKNNKKTSELESNEEILSTDLDLDSKRNSSLKSLTDHVGKNLENNKNYFEENFNYNDADYNKDYYYKNDGTIYENNYFSNDTYDDYEYANFECDGKSLSIEQLCDRKKDCMSGIDETRDTCETYGKEINDNDGFDYYNPETTTLVTSKTPISKIKQFIEDNDYLTDPSRRSSKDENSFYDDYFYDDDCTTNEFQCGDGSCIHKFMKCDGFPDCNSGEDETDCDAQSRLTGKKIKVFQIKKDEILSNYYSDDFNASLLNKMELEKNKNSIKSNYNYHKRVYSQNTHDDLKISVKHNLLKLIKEVSKLIDYQTKFEKSFTNDSELVKLHIIMDKNAGHLKDTFIKYKDDFKLNMDVTFFI